MIDPIINTMISQIVNNVLSVALEDIKNPYAKALLEPVTTAFTQGVLNGLSSLDTGRKIAEQLAPGDLATQERLSQQFTPLVDQTKMQMDDVN
jgi:hypothetical protein